MKNQQVGQRTKHIDVRYHFIRDLWENGELQVSFVKSEENESDLLTKNTTEAIHLHLSARIRDGSLSTYENWEEVIKDAGL